MKLRVLFGCLLLLFVLAANALAGPTTIEYQGRLTDNAGMPVPDGTYQIVFAIYTSTISKYAAWTSAAQTVTVQGGVFSTTVAPPQSLILGYDTLWLQTKVNGTSLTKLQLQTVPYAIRADSADIAKTVADGSITTDKLALDIALARAQFVTGISSSLPAGLQMRFYLDNVLIGGSPVMAAPYEEQVEVVWYEDGVDITKRCRPGRIKGGKVTIRRPVSTDTTLRQLSLNVASGQVTRKTLAMVLVNGTTEVARWTLSNAWVSSYKYRMADDSLPVEEVTFTSEGTAVRTAVLGTVGIPQQQYRQQGFTSGQSSGTTYELLAAGVAIQDVAMATDMGWEQEVIEYLDTDGKTIRKRPGAFTPKSFVVRQNPMSRSEIPAWYKSVTNGTVTRKTITSGLVSGGVRQNLIQYADAWPYSYTLKMADDGMPVEEYEFIYERVIQP